MVMGTCNSRPENETIEDTVTNLIIRIDEEEGKVHYYVKRQISEALFLYSTKLENNYSERNDRIKDLILQAKRKLHSLETSRYGSFHYKITADEEVVKIKKYFKNIQKRMELNQINQDEYEDILNTVAAYAQKLNVCHKALMCRQDKEDLAVLITNLFIRSPTITISRVLAKILENLEAVLSDFDRINMEEASGCNENAKVLKEIVEKVESIKKKLKKC